ncbi:20076_t:CDS:1, partial [Funneliformis geosporum]
MSSDSISEADSFLSLASTHSQPSDKKIQVVSDVWDYFQKIIDENNVLKSKKCKLCHATFAAT